LSAWGALETPITLYRHATANACADSGSAGESDSTPLQDYAWNVKLACRKDTEHPALHVEPYWRDTLVLIVPPHHRLATQPAVTLADLVGETWIFREAGSASGQVVHDVLNGAHLVQDHTLVLQGSEGVKQAVMAGLGIAMVSRFAVTLEVQQGVLRVVPITDIQAERDLCLLWRHDNRLPAAVRAFLDVLHEEAPRVQEPGT